MTTKPVTFLVILLIFFITDKQMTFNEIILSGFYCAVKN